MRWLKTLIHKTEREFRNTLILILLPYFYFHLGKKLESKLYPSQIGYTRNERVFDTQNNRQICGFEKSIFGGTLFESIERGKVRKKLTVKEHNIKSIKHDLVLCQPAVYEALDAIKAAVECDDWGEVKAALGFLRAYGVTGELQIEMLEREGFIEAVEVKRPRYGLKMR